MNLVLTSTAQTKAGRQACHIRTGCQVSEALSSPSKAELRALLKKAVENTAALPDDLRIREFAGAT